MGEVNDRGNTPGAVLALAATAGAMAGAATLAWWLLAEAQRQRVADRQRRLRRLSSFQGGAIASDSSAKLPLAARNLLASPRSGGNGELHDRVQQLNQAIEEVRRQLEHLQSQP